LPDYALLVAFGSYQRNSDCQILAGNAIWPWAPIGSLVRRRYLAVAAYLAAVGQDHDSPRVDLPQFVFAMLNTSNTKVCRDIALHRRLHSVGDATPRRRTKCGLVDNMQAGYHTPMSMHSSIGSAVIPAPDKYQ